MANKILQAFQIIMATVGLGLMIWKIGFAPTLGVFLLVWANNIDYKRK